MWTFLRTLDVSRHLEWLDDVDRDEIASRFARLEAELNATFATTCVADRTWQDTACHTRLTVPAEATSTGADLVILLSSFGDLALVTLEGPGIYLREEMGAWSDGEDLTRIHRTLDDLRLLVIAEDDLEGVPYDGVFTAVTEGAFGGPDWYERFFGFF